MRAFGGTVILSFNIWYNETSGQYNIIASKLWANVNHRQLIDLRGQTTINSAISFESPYTSIKMDIQSRNRGAERKAKEAHLIHKGNTLSPLGINRHDEAR